MRNAAKIQLVDNLWLIFGKKTARNITLDLIWPRPYFRFTNVHISLLISSYSCKGFFIERRVSKPRVLYAIFIKLLVFVYESLPIGERKLSSLGSLLKGFSDIARKGLLQSACKSRNLSRNLVLQAEIGSLSYLKYDNHSFVSLKSRR